MYAIADPSAITGHKIFSVTSSSFEVSWSVEPLLNHTFQIEVYKGKELIQAMETTNMTLDVFGLEAGIMYTVKISYEACGKNVISQRNVKTGTYHLTNAILPLTSTHVPPTNFCHVLLSVIFTDLTFNK